MQIIKATADFESVKSEVKKTNTILESQGATLDNLQKEVASTVTAFNTLEAALANIAKMTSSIGITISTMQAALAQSTAASARNTAAIGTLYNAYGRAIPTIQSYAAANIQAATAKNQSTAATMQNVTAAATLTSATNTAAASTKNLTQSTNQANEAAGKLIISWESLVRLLTIQILHQAVSLLTQQFREATKEASELQLELARVVAHSDDLSRGINVWAKELRVISESTGIEMLDITKAAYETVSNQIAQGTEAAEFVNTASKLALAAVGTQVDAISALSSVINAYKLNITDTEAISGKLIETIRLGRLTLADLASELGSVTPIAHQLGISIDELLGSVGELTTLGMSTSESVTQLRNMFLKLIIPTKEMRKLWDEMGVTSGRALINTYGWVGALQKMREHAGGSVETLAMLNDRIRGFSAAAEFTSRQGITRLKEYVDTIADSSIAYTERTKVVMETSAKQWDMITEKMRNVFLLDIGPKMLAMLVSTSKAVGGFDNALKGLIKTVEVSLVPLMSVLIWKFGKFALMHPYILGIAAAIETVALVLGNMEKKNATDLDAMEQKWSKTGTSVEKSINRMARAWQGTLSEVESQSDIVYSAITEGAKETLKDIGKTTDDFAKKFESGFRDGMKSIDEQVKVLETSIKGLQRIQLDSSNALAELGRDTNKQMFDFSFDDKKPLEQFRMLMTRVKSLKTELGQALELSDVTRIGKELSSVLLRAKGVQDEMAKTNKRNSEERIKLLEEEEDLRLDRKGTKDTGERNKIDAELDRIKIKLQELHDIKIPNTEIPKQYFDAMQDVDGRLRTLRNEAFKEERAQIEEKAKLERKQNELTFLMKKVQETKINDLLATQLSTDPTQRKTQIAGIETTAKDYGTSVSRIAELMQSMGVADEGFIKTSKSYNDLLASLVNQFKIIDTYTTKHVEATGIIDQFSSAIDSTTKILIERNKELRKLEQKGKLIETLKNEFESPAEKAAREHFNQPHPADTYQQRITKSIAVLENDIKSATAFQAVLQKQQQTYIDAMKNKRVVEEGSTKSLSDLKLEIDALVPKMKELTDTLQGLESGKIKVEAIGPAVSGQKTYGAGVSAGQAVLRTTTTGGLANQFVTKGSPTNQVSNSSVSIGDLNITMQSLGNVKYDAAQLGNQIKRLIRQDPQILPQQTKRQLIINGVSY